MWQLNSSVGLAGISGKSNRKMVLRGFSSSFSMMARNVESLITTPFNSNALILFGKRFVAICLFFNDFQHRLKFITRWVACDPPALEET